MGACAKCGKAMGDCCKTVNKCFKATWKCMGICYAATIGYIGNLIDKFFHSALFHLSLIYVVNAVSIFFSIVLAYSAITSRNNAKDDKNISDGDRDKVLDISMAVAFVIATTFLYRMLILLVIPCVSYYHDGGLWVYTSPKTLPKTILGLTLISSFVFAIFSYFIVKTYLEVKKYYSERFLVWYFVANSNELMAVVALIFVILYKIHEGGKKPRNEENLITRRNNRAGDVELADNGNNRVQDRGPNNT